MRPVAHPSRRAQERAPQDEGYVPRMLRSAKRRAADPGSIVARGPGSAVHREERCTASGTRDALLHTLSGSGQFAHNWASFAMGAPSPPARNSELISIIAASAPQSSAAMKPGRSTGRMPENVLVIDRAMATAGLAN